MTFIMKCLGMMILVLITIPHERSSIQAFIMKDVDESGLDALTAFINRVNLLQLDPGQPQQCFLLEKISVSNVTENELIQLNLLLSFKSVKLDKQTSSNRVVVCSKYVSIKTTTAESLLGILQSTTANEKSISKSTIIKSNERRKSFSDSGPAGREFANKLDRNRLNLSGRQVFLIVSCTVVLGCFFLTAALLRCKKKISSWSKDRELHRRDACRQSLRKIVLQNANESELPFNYSPEQEYMEPFNQQAGHPGMNEAKMDCTVSIHSESEPDGPVENRSGCSSVSDSNAVTRGGQYPPPILSHRDKLLQLNRYQPISEDNLIASPRMSLDNNETFNDSMKFYPLMGHTHDPDIQYVAPRTEMIIRRPMRFESCDNSGLKNEGSIKTRNVSLKRSKPPFNRHSTKSNLISKEVNSGKQAALQWRKPLVNFYHPHDINRPTLLPHRVAGNLQYPPYLLPALRRQNSHQQPFHSSDVSVRFIPAQDYRDYDFNYQQASCSDYPTMSRRNYADTADRENPTNETIDENADDNIFEYSHDVHFNEFSDKDQNEESKLFNEACSSSTFKQESPSSPKQESDSVSSEFEIRKGNFIQ